MSKLFTDSVEVSQFPPEEDGYEYEYETSYVTLDVGNINQNLLLNATSCKLIGLDTPTPYLQLPGITLRGTHDELIGSELVFADGRDLDNRSRRFVTHLGTTSHRITFEPVQLKSRNPDAFIPQEDVSIPPPVLFQGPRKRATGSKDLATGGEDINEPSVGKRGRGKGKGRARTTVEAVERPADDSKGKNKARAEANEEDSASDGEVNYDNLDGDSDDEVAEPGLSARRTSSRQTKRSSKGREMDLDMLESLESMDIEGGGDD